MVCNKCRNIISENSIKCPYCGNRTAEDYFGYQRADAMMRAEQAQPKKKDNSAKIILIVLSGIGGLFSILIMLLFAFSGSGSSQNSFGNSTVQYDAVFEVCNDFELIVTGSSLENFYINIASRQLGVSDTFEVASGSAIGKSYADGVYEVVVMKGLNDGFRIQMTVSSLSEYDRVDIQYDKKQIVTQGDDVQAEYNSTIHEITTQSGQTVPNENNNQASSSQNNSSSADVNGDMFYAISGVVRPENNVGNNSFTVSYEKTCDGYTMTIREAVDGHGYTVYFDKNKRLSEVCTHDGDRNLSCVFNYDSYGRIISKVVTENEYRGYTIQYTYDSEGRLVSQYRSGTYGMAWEYISEYSGPQLIRRYEDYTANWVDEFSYGDGRITEISRITKDRSEKYSLREYRYNTDGFITLYRNTAYYNNSVNSLSEYNYNYTGNKIVSISGFDMQDGVKDNFEKSFVYDNYGNIVKIVRNSDSGVTEEVFTYSYISSEYDGLFDEYCEKFCNHSTEYYLYGTGCDYTYDLR